MGLAQVAPASQEGGRGAPRRPRAAGRELPQRGSGEALEVLVKAALEEQRGDLGVPRADAAEGLDEVAIWVLGGGLPLIYCHHEALLSQPLDLLERYR